jgi:regulation of enolase protein 1 (concanavalin A-like superfamily)
VLAADEGIAEKKLDELKAATVYVKVEGKQGTVTGSGFLMLVDGETGFVATNRHVVAAIPGRFTPQKYSLVFWSGTKKEQVMVGEVVALDPDQDLAVLKVTSKNLPAPLDLAQAVKPRETMTVYTLGFPLGDLLSPNKSNPSVTIGKGAVSSLREDERGKLQRVQLDGELNPGNSGGPVVAADGKLVGIAVAKIVGTKIGFAIPPAELSEMLKGRAAAVVIRGLRVDNSVAELEMEVPLIDPLGKLKAVELRHIRKDALKAPPQADKDGNWPDLPGAEKLAVKIEGGKALAKISLKAPEKKSLDWFFQTAYTDRQGKSIATQPIAQPINFAATGLARQDGPGARLWETVTSKEGGFTVDMPAKPTINTSSTRKTAAGTVKMLLIGCDYENAGYLVFRIDMPMPVPKEIVEKILDGQRDFFAEEWQGKVIREKKVLAQRKYWGRDFTIQGKPDERGISAIRVRQYLVGKSIFVVAVLSAPGWELPEDAGRFLGSLTLGEAGIRTTGTPEPEPKGTELKGWGLAIDTDNDCKFTPGNKGLTVDLPATLHDSFGPRKFNAPRVMREVDGDFVLTVKVAGDFKPGPKSTQPTSVPYLAGGILVWSDSDNLIRMERAAFLRGGKIITSVAFMETEGGSSGAVHNEPLKAGDCYLRLERKSSQFLGSVSSDGTNWKQLKPIDTIWPSKLKVGLLAITTSSTPFSVNFEEFDLKAKGMNAKP